VGEYPLLLVLALLAAPWAGRGKARQRALLDLLLPAGLFVLSLLLTRLLPSVIPFRTRILLVLALPLILAYMASQRPPRFALALAAVWLAVSLNPGSEGTLLFRQRNFFGTLRVTADASGPFYCFYHGTTLHGLQFSIPERCDEPLAYYHRLGPCGAVMARHQQQPAGKRVAVIGLGIGATLAYARSDEEWTVYEIDPAVVKVARKSPWFSHWRRSPARSIHAKVGDARLGLQQAAAGEFGLIILDAFSSDSVPVHLLTREALQLYLSRLAPGGLLAANISSWNMDLSRVMAGLAEDAGLACFNWRDDRVLSPSTATLGKYPSSWVVLARRESDLGGLAGDPRWRRLQPLKKSSPWTDSYSNILDVLNWL
jgi:spermidine synthase